MTDDEELQCVTVDVEVVYGIKRASNVEVVFIHEDTEQKSSAVTNSSGECTVNIYGSSLDEILGTYLVDVACEKYSTNTNSFIVTGENNRLILYLNKLDECNNVILTNKNCKYFHHEPYMTPNNYDIYFDSGKIPANIQKESPSELLKRLQRTMPLTDILHLNLHSENDNYEEVVNIHTGLHLKYKTVIPDIAESRIKITGIWNESIESETTGTKTYEIHYLYDETMPLANVQIKLINIQYPLVQYTGKTNEEGNYTFENIPYGEYVVQFIIEGFNLSPSVVKINQESSTERILVGSIEDINTNLNVYAYGILSTPSIDYENGEATYVSGVEYEEGSLIIGHSEEDGDDANIFINTEEYEEITDFTEFTVDIIGINDEIADSLPLNFMNNYTNISKTLPLYQEGERINYTFRYSQDNCSVDEEYIDSLQLEDNEVILI